MIYNSPQYCVVEFRVGDAPLADSPVQAAPGAPGPRGGYEIVDKLARREIFLQGVLAQRFREGVGALIAEQPTVEALDAFVAGFTGLAQQPLVMH